jgi:hypothetical protein
MLPDNIEEIKQELIKSDADMIRVLEDLIEVLMAKGLLNFTDFHIHVQRKLLHRRDLRWKLHQLNSKQNLKEQKP